MFIGAPGVLTHSHIKPHICLVFGEGQVVTCRPWDLRSGSGDAQHVRCALLPDVGPLPKLQGGAHVLVPGQFERNTVG